MTRKKISEASAKIRSTTLKTEAFRQRIYRLVQAIPRGLVISYAQLAQLAGEPRWARQVGIALRNAPDTAQMPWHRVVGSQGRIAERKPKHGHAPSADQAQLLQKEGVIFERQRVAVRCFWEPQNDGLALSALLFSEEENGIAHAALKATKPA